MIPQRVVDFELRHDQSSEKKRSIMYDLYKYIHPLLRPDYMVKKKTPTSQSIYWRDCWKTVWLRRINIYLFRPYSVKNEPKKVITAFEPATIYINLHCCCCCHCCSCSQLVMIFLLVMRTRKTVIALQLVAPAGPVSCCYYVVVESSQGG